MLYGSCGGVTQGSRVWESGVGPRGRGAVGFGAVGSFGEKASTTLLSNSGSLNLRKLWGALPMSGINESPEVRGLIS